MFVVFFVGGGVFAICIVVVYLYIQEEFTHTIRIQFLFPHQHREMIDIYEERGMSRTDATIVVETMAKYEQFFVDVMMKEELELQVPDKNHTLGSFKEGVVMFFSFAVFGSFPLLGYIIIPISFPTLGEESLFVSACVVTGLVLFCLGCYKSRFSVGKWYISGLETLTLGGACATVAYTIGQAMDKLIT